MTRPIVLCLIGFLLAQTAAYLAARAHGEHAPWNVYNLILGD